MQISKKEKETINKALAHWEDCGLIDAQKAKELDKSIKIKPFNWQSLAYYSFLFAVVSLLIAVISIFADKALLDLIDSLISTSYVTKSITFLLLSALFFWLDYRYNLKKTRKKYSREIFTFFAAIFLAIAAGLISFLFGMEENPGVFILGLAISYFTLAVARKKELLWLFGITALVVAFGAVTHNLGKDNYLFIGMNFPMRFTIFGALILLATYFIKKSEMLKPFLEPTYWSGLIIFFMALWFLTIFGNYSSYEKWLEIRQYYLWWYSLLLLLASFGAIVIGIKKEDSLLKNIGISFIFLNLYTRYFEYFWDELHKALFFGIIAISFWLIGKKAEKIWDKEDK
ncbi:membrane protein [Marivirga tractuosa]|uniref:DUF2157 domain-containing protein n=1 Tax=Marivirga tractuosa (strain ATCC 23168 / DSM 4126 / NBRC 15989 / NCIMB 1408 / VKM B-1430 / H-43) TaxID=643867 RepID=E4TP29_MARTH|nr:hypothetical protein [Marivirga tractuosa]ADR23563.1 hypothetical protein Ftrac_3593 [Marivirga tractuosa DSM 4126]BDD15758.1 membrane protein [Marivirga tractuosa]